jgi:hypothetical protein
MLFKTFGQLKQGGCAFEHLLAHIFCSGIKLAAHQLRQIPIQGTHGGADGHVVVVQDHQQLCL